MLRPVIAADPLDPDREQHAPERPLPSTPRSPRPRCARRPRRSAPARPAAPRSGGRSRRPFSRARAPSASSPASRRCRRRPSPRARRSASAAASGGPGQSRFGQCVKTPSVLDRRRAADRASAPAAAAPGARSARSTTCGAGETTCGITSPARSTITSSPGRTSLRARSSSLCSVACLTVTPPTCTGSSSANGCSEPNLPTFHFTSSSLVTAVVGGNFHAIAQRGSRPTTPSRRCSS